MLPPTCVGIPAALSNSPINDVVVVLPFVPVMATMRPFKYREASSTSPITSAPPRSAYRIGMAVAGTPGLMTTKSTWSRSQLGASPGKQPIPSLFSASASALQFSIGFESLSATVAPRAARNLAHAMPLRAAPTTKTFLPATSKQIHILNWSVRTSWVSGWTVSFDARGLAKTHPLTQVVLTSP